MESSISRIKTDIEYIAAITSTPKIGFTRFSYSKEDKQTREYLLKKLKDLNLDIRIDGVGNIRAKYKNNNKPSVMIGSHIDTVAHGGKFDGLTGVICALEVIRVIKENNFNLENPLELIIFAEEEGSNFGITLFGSKIMTGKYKLNDLKKIKNEKGTSSYKVMSNFGLNVESVNDHVLKKGEIKAMIELHVEQGGILDTEAIPIGIVRAIVGMKTYKISLKGISNHAGTTPMHLRKDPLVGAAEIIAFLEKAVKNITISTTVVTVGKIDCKPNMPNVIPEEVIFYADIRDVKPKGIELAANKLLCMTNEVATKRNLSSSVELIGESKSVELSTKIVETIKQTATKMGYKYKIMNSGAVHDVAMLTELTDVGMIFVPSVGGMSHCPEELTNYDDIKLGCDLLLQTVIKLANG